MGSNADSQVIWMEGKLVPYADAKVHVLSHSLHYGTGAFEGIRAYKTADGRTAIFRAEEHFQRFFESVHSLGLSCKYTVSDLIAATCETIKANDFKECYVRPLAYLDDSVRGLKLPDDPKALVAIACWGWGKYMGDDGQNKGIRIMTSTYRRADISTSLPLAKLTGNYITSVLARREATKNGMDEALLLDQQGFVAEGSGENIFLVKNKEIVTPPIDYILPGITRDCVFQIAKGMGYTVRESRITRNQLYVADELFFSGTAVEVTPIREVDHHKIGDGKPGPIFKQIFETFFKTVQGEVPKYASWLKYV